VSGRLELGGVPAARAFTALRALEPDAHACYFYDLDALERRARRFLAAFAALAPTVVYAIKANGLPALLERLAALGLGAEAGSLGELELARAAGFGPERRVLNGNGRTAEEAAWAAREGVALVNADSAGELDLLERAAASGRAGAVRVALRVNPEIGAGGHPFIQTGNASAKFGIAPLEALELWAVRTRWPHLVLDGIHIHVGSQILDPAPLEEARAVALEIAAESARRGAPLALVNMGGGLGVDYSGGGAEFPLEAFAERWIAGAAGSGLEWVLEPGRWLVAPVGVLIAEVLAVKRRGSRRFVVLGAGMNDFLRPALYHAAHRIEPLERRPGPPESAVVVGPVCESSDVFAAAAELPPLEPGDLCAICDVGAYGASMASNYNGRGRLAELVASAGRLTRARAGESPADLLARLTRDELRW